MEQANLIRKNHSIFDSMSISQFDEINSAPKTQKEKKVNDNLMLSTECVFLSLLLASNLQLQNQGDVCTYGECTTCKCKDRIVKTWHGCECGCSRFSLPCFHCFARVRQSGGRVMLSGIATCRSSLRMQNDR